MHFHCVPSVISCKTIRKGNINREGGGLFQELVISSFLNGKSTQKQNLCSHRGLKVPLWTPSCKGFYPWSHKLNLHFKSGLQEKCLDKAMQKEYESCKTCSVKDAWVTRPKNFAKKSNTLYCFYIFKIFYHYLHCRKPYSENIFKIAYVIFEKSEK